MKRMPRDLFSRTFENEKPVVNSQPDLLRETHKVQTLSKETSESRPMKSTEKKKVVVNEIFIRKPSFLKTKMFFFSCVRNRIMPKEYKKVYEKKRFCILLIGKGWPEKVKAP
jgi:hypothetical protein